MMCTPSSDELVPGYLQISVRPSQGTLDLVRPVVRLRRELRVRDVDVDREGAVRCLPD